MVEGPSLPMALLGSRHVPEGPASCDLYLIRGPGQHPSSSLWDGCTAFKPSGLRLAGGLPRRFSRHRLRLRATVLRTAAGRLARRFPRQERRTIDLGLPHHRYLIIPATRLIEMAMTTAPSRYDMSMCLIAKRRKTLERRSVSET